MNWLLRCVTQPICLHDLLWYFVSSLTPSSGEDEDQEEEEEDKDKKKDDNKVKKDQEASGINACNTLLLIHWLSHRLIHT